MRLVSFSTLGCPGLEPTEVAALAGRHGIGSVELLCADDEPLRPDLDADGLSRLRGALDPVAIMVVCGYVRVGRDGPDEQVVDDLVALLRVADTFGAGGVRVFPGDAGVGSRRMGARLRAAVEQAPGEAGLWLETHDTHARGAAAAEVLAAAEHPRVGAIWDLAHPWVAGEQPEQTAAALAPYLRHVQIKDEDANRNPRPPGQGVLPLDRLLDAAGGLGITDLGLEWELKWHRDAGPLEDALAATTDWLARRS